MAKERNLIEHNEMQRILSHVKREVFLNQPLLMRALGYIPLQYPLPTLSAPETYLLIRRCYAPGPILFRNVKLGERPV